jgi:hypothetical protein
MKAGSNFERLQSISIDEFADWLDKNGQFDTAPWTLWFAKKYCDNCKSIECHYVDAKEKLGITPFYNDTIECAYCELADESGVKRCRFFPKLDDIPNNREVIRMWLEEDADVREV